MTEAIRGKSGSATGLSAVFDQLFGFDAFISYARVDASNYARALGDELQASGLRVCLDRDEFAAGEPLDATTSRHIRKSSVLVIVVSPAALSSPHVAQEVELFAASGRKIVPIDVDGALVSAGTDNPVAARTAGLIYVPEEAVLAAGPTPQVLQMLRQSFDFTTQAVKRTRAMAVTTTFFAITALAATVGFVWASYERERAETNASIAEAQERMATQRAITLHTERGRVLLLDDQPDKAAVHLSEAHRLGAGRSDLAARPALEFLTGQTMQRLRGLERTLSHHGDDVQQIDVSPDGRLVLSGSADESVLLCDVATGATIARFDRSTPGTGAAVFDPTGQRIFVMGPPRIADLDGATLATFGLGYSGGRQPVWSPDGRYCACLADDKKVALIDPETGDLIRWLSPTREDKSWSTNGAIALDASGARLAYADNAGLYVWNTRTGEAILDLPLTEILVVGLGLRPDGGQVAAGTRGGRLIVWDVAAKAVQFEGEKVGNEVDHLAYSRSGDLLATGGADGSVAVYEASTGRRTMHLQSARSGVNSVCVAPGDDVVLYSNKDGAFIAEIATGQQLCALDLHAGRVSTARFDDGGDRVFTAGRDGAIRIWRWRDRPRMEAQKLYDQQIVRGTAHGAIAHHVGRGVIVVARSGAPLETWDLERCVMLRRAADPEMVADLAFHPTGDYFASIDLVGTVRFRTTDELEPLGDLSAGKTLGILGRTIGQVSFDASGERFLTVAAPGLLRVWDTATKREIAQLESSLGAVTAATFLAGGPEIAVGHATGRVHVWNPEGAPRALDGTQESVNSVHPSADGRLLLSTGTDGTAILRDVATGTVRHTLRGHAGPVSTGAFDPRGLIVATAGSDGTARLWDVATGRSIAVLTPKLTERPQLIPGLELEPIVATNKAVRSVAFHPDGSLVATGSQDGSAHLWDAATGAPVWTVEHPSGAGFVRGVTFTDDGRRLLLSGTEPLAQEFAKEENAAAAMTTYVRERLGLEIRDGRPVQVDRGAAPPVDGAERRAEPESAQPPPELAAEVTDAIAKGGERLRTGPRDEALVTLSRAYSAGADHRDLRYLIAAALRYRDDRERPRDVVSQGEITAVAFAPDGDAFAIATRAGSVALHSAEDGALLRRGETSTEASEIVFRSDGGQLAVGGPGPKSVVLDSAALGVVASLEVHGNPVGFDRRGNLLTSGSELTRWDVSSGTAVNRHRCAGSARPDPTGRVIVGTTPSLDANTQQLIVLQDLRTGAAAELARVARSFSEAFTWSADGQFVAHASTRLRAWHVPSATEVMDVAVECERPAFSRDGSVLVAISPDGVLVCGTGSRQLLEVLPHRYARGVAIHPDGNTALTISGQGVSLWDLTPEARSPQEVAAALAR